MVNIDHDSLVQSYICCTLITLSSLHNSLVSSSLSCTEMDFPFHVYYPVLLGYKVMGTHILKAVPSAYVYALQCLTGKINNKNRSCLHGDNF